MPNSLRAKLSKLRYKGEITQEEYSELIKELDGHDSELLKAKEEVINQFKWERDVAISQLEDIGAGLGLDMKLWLKEHDTELLDKVEEKLKARVMICANCEIMGCDTEYFAPMCDEAEAGIFAREFNEYVEEVISEMKSEVENGTR